MEYTEVGVFRVNHMPEDPPTVSLSLSEFLGRSGWPFLTQTVMLTVAQACALSDALRAHALACAVEDTVAEEQTP